MAIVTGARLRVDIEALAAIGRDPEGGITRRAFTPADLEARRWLIGRMEDAGLEARLDAAGNVIGRLPPSPGHAPEPAVVVGSHIDTVPRAGPLDGALGVLAGLEVARRLREDGIARHRALEVIGFSDEEGRFGAFLGSQALTGTLDLARVPQIRDANGARLVDALRAAGLPPEALPSAARPAGTVSHYLELHIEQGPVLERAGTPIGVVDGIVGQVRMAVHFDGRPDHAGTTPMDCRRDAFAAAALFATRFRELVLEHGEGRAVMTIGIVHVDPGVGNVVPGHVRLGLEIRDLDRTRLKRLAALAASEVEAAARRQNVGARLRTIYETDPAPMSPEAQRLIREEARALGLPTLTLPSGAGHDAQVLAAHVPTGMIFVPSQGGRSHCPEEWTAWSELEAGADVLYRVVARLLGSD